MDTETRPVYMLSTRDPLQIQRHIQTESEGMEEGIPCKWKSKESWSSNTHIRQTSFTTNAKGTSLGKKHKRRKTPTTTNPKHLRKREQENTYR